MHDQNERNIKMAKSYKVHFHVCVQAHARMCVSVLVSDHVKEEQREREREREKGEREKQRDRDRRRGRVREREKEKIR